MKRSCLSKTRKGTLCAKSPIKGKIRCRLNCGLSSGPKTAKGKAPIAAAHFKHNQKSNRFVETRKKIWAELRIIEKRECGCMGLFDT
jgi:hypothetical protein